MALRNGWPAVSGAANQFDIRAALRVNFAQSADGTLAQGLIPNDDSIAGVVRARSDMQLDILGFSGVIDRNGPVLLHNDGTTQLPLDPAPNANVRIDAIWMKQQEAASPISDSTDGPIFGKTSGDPNVDPVAPAIPEGALKLAEVTVPSTATATNSQGVEIKNLYPFTASSGGKLYFRDKSALTAFKGVEWQEAVVLGDADAGIYRVKNGIWDHVSQIPRIENGDVTFASVKAMNTASIHIDFTEAFPEVPRIQVSINKVPPDSKYGYLSLTAGNRSTTGFDLFATNAWEEERPSVVASWMAVSRT